MKLKKLLCLIAMTGAAAGTAHGQGTAFTYQGRLQTNGLPFAGQAEVEASLWDASTAGAQIAANLAGVLTVGVTNGLFTMPLDFGASFPGADRWLNLNVRTVIGPFTPLSPRQKITPAPYAITASRASSLTGPLSSAQLAGTYLSAVSLSNFNNVFLGAHLGNGAGLSNVNASALGGLNASNLWRVGGNDIAPGQFLGTTNNQPLEFRVNNLRALRLEDGVASGIFQGFRAPNLIAGSPANFVGPGIGGATISGGGATNQDGTVLRNSVRSDFGTVGGGEQNQVQSNSSAATLSGGRVNLISASSPLSTIAGGGLNSIGSNSAVASVGGGGLNKILNDSFYATIPGGYCNEATNHAFAAGTSAQARHTGAFVWADYAFQDFASSGPNQFCIRASGGIHTATNTSLFFGKQERQMLNLWDTNYAIGVQLGTLYSRTFDGFAWFKDGHHVDDSQYDPGPGGSVLMALSATQLHVTGNILTDGTITPNSDRNKKTDFAPVDTSKVLERVAMLPIQQWRFKTEAAEVKHVGPMAQDFREAFGLGAHPTAIATVDADGVALAAIQGLNQKLEKEMRRRDREIRDLKQLVETLMKKVEQQATR